MYYRVLNMSAHESDPNKYAIVEFETLEATEQGTGKVIEFFASLEAAYERADKLNSLEHN